MAVQYNKLFKMLIDRKMSNNHWRSRQELA